MSLGCDNQGGNAQPRWLMSPFSPAKSAMRSSVFGGRHGCPDPERDGSQEFG